MDWPAVTPTAAGLDPVKLEAWRSTLAAHRTTGLDRLLEIERRTMKAE